MTDSDRIAALRGAAHPIVGTHDDYDPMLEDLARARFVLLGAGTHGTHEFYRERSRITRRLIARHGFVGVAAEADGPDAARVHRHVTGRSDSDDALADFESFPDWIWRNADTLDFVGWLRAHRERQAGVSSAGFYGIDVYSLHRTANAVLGYLAHADPDAVPRARALCASLDLAGVDPRAYGLGPVLGVAPACEDAVVRTLEELRARRPGRVAVRPDAEEASFIGEKTAKAARDAADYYRGLLRRRVNTWALRGTHMVDTLGALSAHLEGALGRPARLVVWAHTSHCGDARATRLAEQGAVNMGQLARERWGDDVRLVGFTTHFGTVTAASSWGGPAERKRVRPARSDSWEALFHRVGRPRWWVDTREPRARAALEGERLMRGIGVLYLPHSERQSHYQNVRIADQLDYLLHFDHTRALEPLERTAEWEAGEVPESFPTAR